MSSHLHFAHSPAWQAPEDLAEDLVPRRLYPLPHSSFRCRSALLLTAMTASEFTPLRASASAPAPRLGGRVMVATAAAAFVVGSALFATSSRMPHMPSFKHEPVVSLGQDVDDWFCGEKNVETGYVKLFNKKDDHYFFWFAGSRSETPDSDPLVVWLNGGPGSSSLEGLLVENGPCLVQPDLSLKSNPYAWNNNANVIWLEQPSGVGFSYFNDESDRDATGEDVGANMYAFLDGFLDQHPEFVGRPLYLTGESYAGHYIPASAHHIWQKNKASEAEVKRINLQGVAIGNGDPNLPLQYKSYVKMATENNYNLTLLSDEQIAQMNVDSEICSQRLTTCQPFADGENGCQAASDFCGDKLLAPYVGARRNLYNILETCETEAECYDTDGGVVEKFLKSEDVTSKLYPTLKGRVWGSQGAYVNHAYVSSGDWARSYAKEIADLLNDGMRMLIFAGDADLVCNWIGNREWTLALDWQGKQQYNAAVETEFVVSIEPLLGNADAPTTIAGSVWQHENLVFVRVSGAGHLVPKIQPLSAFVMIDRFLKGEEF